MKKKQQIFLLSIMLFFCMVFAPPKGQAQTIPVEDILIEMSHPCGATDDTLHFCINTFDTGKLFIYAWPYNATIRDVTVVSSNPSVAKVERDTTYDGWDFDSHWFVYAKSEGEAIITVTSLDPSYTEEKIIKVVVSNIPVEGIAYEYGPGCYDDYQKICLINGDVGMVDVYVWPHNATFKGVTLQSSNTDILAFSVHLFEEGRFWYNIHALSTGEATITIRSLDPNYTEVTNIDVKVRDIQQGEMCIVGGDIEIMEGDWLGVYATTCGPNFMEPYQITNVTWSSSNTAVVGFDEYNRLTGMGVGNAIITATFKEITATCEVTVKHRPPAKPNMPKLMCVHSLTEERQIILGDYYPYYGTGFFQYWTVFRIISDDPAAYEIIYTTDGSDPLSGPGEKNHVIPASKGSGFIYLAKDMRIRAVAIRTDPGYPNVVSNELNLKLLVMPNPPCLGSMNHTNFKLHNIISVNYCKKYIYQSDIVYGNMIYLSPSGWDSNVQIYYTLDGSEPNEKSRPYIHGISTLNPYNEGPFNNYPLTLKAKAYIQGCSTPSETFHHVFYVLLPEPELDVLEGIITCQLPGASGGCIYGASLSYRFDKGNFIPYEWPEEISTNFPSCKILEACVKKPGCVPSYKKFLFCGDSPPPILSLWNYKKQAYVPFFDSNGKTFIVADQDTIKLEIPGYKDSLRTKIYYTDTGLPVQLDHSLPNYNPGQLYPPDYGYVIYRNTILNAASQTYNPPNKKPSPNQKFIIELAQELAKPTFSNNYVVVNAGTPLRFLCATQNIDGFVFTTDGTTPSIQQTPPGAGEYNSYYGISYQVHGYITDSWGNSYCGPEDKYASWRKLTIDKTGLFKVIAFKRNAVNDGVITSEVNYKEYRVQAQKKEMNITNGIFQQDMPGDKSSTCGFGGKLLKFALEAIGAEYDDIGDIAYYAIGKNWKQPLADEEKIEAYQNLDAGLDAKDRKKVTKDLEPFGLGGGSPTLAYKLEAAGLVKAKFAGGVSLAGKMMLYGSGHGETKASYPLLPPLNITARLGLSGEISAFLGLGLGTKLDASFSAQNSGFDYTASLQYLIKIVAGVGLSLPFGNSIEIVCEGQFNHLWNIKDSKHNIWLNGSVYSIGKAFGFEVYRHAFIDKCFKQIYKNYKSGSPSDSTDFAFFPDLPDIEDLFKPDFSTTKMNGWRPISRDYLKKRSAWLGSTPPARDGSIYHALQTSIYSETEPKIAEANGKRIMVFLTDDELRDDYNRSLLVYSVYNSVTNTWSNPVAVNNNGRADYYPCLKSNGTDIWVAWQNSNKLFTAASTIEEMFLAGKVCVSKFNTATSTFAPPSNLSDGFSPKIAVSPTGDACVTWTHNSTGDIYGTNNQTKIRESHSTSGVWSTPKDLKTGLGAINNVDVSWFNEKYQVAYVADMDNDFSTTDDHSLFMMDLTGAVLQTPVTKKTVIGLRYATIGNSKILSWIENDRLRFMTEGGAIQNLTDSADMFTGNYKFFTNGTKTALVYPYRENGLGYLFARHYDAGKLGTQFKLITSGGFAGLYDGLLENNGDFYVAYNNSKIETVSDDDYKEENDLIAVRCPAPVNIRLLDIDYRHEKVKLGQPLPLGLEIENIGGVTVNNVTVKVNDVAAGTYPVNLNIAEKKIVNFSLPIPTGMAPLTKFRITVEPTGLTDVNMGDNFIDINPGYVNFSMLLSTTFNDDNTVTVTTNITNNSDYAANVKLTARLGLDGLPVVDVIDLGKLAGRENKVKHLTYNLDALLPEPKERVGFIFELISDKEAGRKTWDYVFIHNLNCTISADSLSIIGIKNPKPVFEDSNSVLVYPNPTTGEVRVELRQAQLPGGQAQFANGEIGIETVDVYDMFGRRVMLHTANHTPHTSFNVAHLQAGIYFLRVQTGNDLVVKKLIKY